MEHPRGGLGVGREREDDDVLDGRQGGELVAQQRVALSRRHDDAHIAVTEDVRDLPRAQQGIDRDEDAVGGRGAEHGDNRLDPLVEPDRDAVATPEPDSGQAGGERLRGAPQFCVRDRRVLERHGGHLRALDGLPWQHVVKSHQHLSNPQSHQATLTSSLYR